MRESQRGRAREGERGSGSMGGRRRAAAAASYQAARRRTIHPAPRGQIRALANAGRRRCCRVESGAFAGPRRGRGAGGTPNGVDRLGRSSSAAPRRAPRPAADHRPAAKNALAQTQLAAAGVASFLGECWPSAGRQRGKNPHGVDPRGRKTRARPPRRARQLAAHPPRPNLGVKQVGAGAHACSSPRSDARATPQARQNPTHDRIRAMRTPSGDSHARWRE